MASLQQGKAQAISRVSTQSNVRNAVIDRSALRQDGSSAPGCTTTFDASPQALIIFCSRVVWSLACMLRSCKRSVQPVSGPSVWIPHGCELELLNAGLRSPLQRHNKTLFGRIWISNTFGTSCCCFACCPLTFIELFVFENSFWGKIPTSEIQGP